MKLPSPIQKLEATLFKEKGVEVYVKRDDLIHPIISGNKWRKLKFNIEKFQQGKYEALLTFGGAFSNHIAATAKAGKELGVKTIGIIRGDELNESSNSTLELAAEDGMQLVFTKREEYDLRDEKYYHEELRRRHGNIWIVPEGGANFHGLLGCQEVVGEIDIPHDYLITACGTGTTACGLILGSFLQTVIGVSVLKGGEFLLENVNQLALEMGEVVEDRFQLITEYHFGGYAKHTDELNDFINVFYKEHGIPLDHVYTGKMMYALMDLIEKDHFPKGSTIVALHTGGLQGAQTMRNRLLFLD